MKLRNTILDPADLCLRFDALIFDCDGTLSDSMPLHYIAWRETMAGYGISFPEERFYSMGGMPSEKIIGILSAEQCVSIDAMKASVEKEQRFVESMGSLQPKHEVCEVARSCHGTLPMAVASGGIRPVIDKQLVQIALSNCFEVIVTAEDTQLHKPEPDVFIEAARQMRVEPTRCLVFEDSELGFAAAESAGMNWIDVR